MGEFSNGLTPSESERLYLLIEEMAEATQSACKILRHGYESFNPFDKDQVKNRSLLEKELGHVLHAMKRLGWAKDIDSIEVDKHVVEKGKTVDQFLHHQRKEYRL